MHVPTVSEDAVSLRVVAAVSLGRESGIRRGGSHITRSAAVPWSPHHPHLAHTLHLPLVLLTAPTNCTEFTEKRVPHMETGVVMDGGRLVVDSTCEM